MDRAEPSRSDSPGPHDNTKPLLLSCGSDSPKCVVIFLHGRGSSPEDDLPVFKPTLDAINAEDPNAVSAIFLRGQDETWYPNHWDQPPVSQEPYLSSALDLIHRTIESLPVPSTRVLLAGFSQGASLSLIYALHRPEKPLGGVFALSGSTIGGPDEWPGAGIVGSPIFVGWGDRDRYYREARVRIDVEGLQDRGAQVELRLYPGMGHYVCSAEVDKFEAMIRDIIGKA